jgi:hypothetical protein
MVECGGGASGAPWSPRSPEATGCDRATAFPLYAPRACRRARFPRHPRKERKPPCGGSVLSVSAAALLFCRSCAGSVQGQRPVHSKGLAPNAPRVRSSGRLGAFSAGAFSPVALFCRLLSVFAPPFASSPTHTTHLPPTMGEQEICRAFRNTGHCRYGEECKFIHEEGPPIAPPNKPVGMVSPEPTPPHASAPSAGQLHARASQRERARGTSRAVAPARTLAVVPGRTPLCGRARTRGTSADGTGWRLCTACHAHRNSLLLRAPATDLLSNTCCCATLRFSVRSASPSPRVATANSATAAASATARRTRASMRPAAATSRWRSAATSTPAAAAWATPAPASTSTSPSSPSASASRVAAAAAAATARTAASACASRASRVR